MFEGRHLCMVLGGVLFGTAGVKILGSKDAKKVYTHVTAAVMRCADSVMETATNIKENCGDIKADADEIKQRSASLKQKVLRQQRKKRKLNKGNRI